MVKRRIETPQARTLHDFFGKPSTSSTPIKKRKTTVPPSTKKAKEKVKRQKSVVAIEDVIVLDSDDDEKHAEAIVIDDSSDIELVEEHVLISERKENPKDRTPSTSKRLLSSSKVSGLSEQTPPKQESITPNSPVSSSFDGFFGEPTSLLPHTDSSPSKDASAEDTGFGVPLLLSGDSTRPSTGTVAESIAQGRDSTSHTSPIEVDVVFKSSSEILSALVEDEPVEGVAECSRPSHTLASSSRLSEPDTLTTPIDNEWGTGDDEVEILNDDFQPIVVEDSSPITEDCDIDLTLDDEDDDDPVPNNPANQACPMCGIGLERMAPSDMQKHVNECMDAFSAPDDVSPPKHLCESSSSPSKDLRPLSSFQPSTLNLSPPPSTSKQKGKEPDSNAFSVLMTSHKENEAWKEAAVAEDRNFRPTSGKRRKAPFYKVMTGMPIAVDAFRYGTIPGVAAYFLTHAHSDHYTNLSSNWKSGPIYCSEGTANLIIHMLSVDRKWVHPLPMDKPTIIPDTGGVQVTLIEANHCPGSCLFMFEGRQTINAGDSAFKSPFVGSSKMFRYLHCGDFRASPQHVRHPAVFGKRIDTVYLDTTYLDPRYCFPPQPQVISACAELAKRLVRGESVNESTNAAGKPTTMNGWFTPPDKLKDKLVAAPTKNIVGKTLVVVGTYSIGKERIVKAVAKALQTKIYCDPRKTAILRCQSDPELHAMLTSNPHDGGVHLLPLGTIASDRLKDYLQRYKGHFNKVIGFRPTGWTYTQPNGSDSLPTIASIIAKSQNRTFTHANLSPMKHSTSTLQVYGVPYSEHSSFFELTCFALSLDWGRMIATVNVGSEASRGKMAKWVEKWEVERKKKGKVEIVSHRAPDYW